jgi:hypothetical protein
VKTPKTVVSYHLSFVERADVSALSGSAHTCKSVHVLHALKSACAVHPGAALLVCMIGDGHSLHDSCHSPELCVQENRHKIDGAQRGNRGNCAAAGGGKGGACRGAVGGGGTVLDDVSSVRESERESKSM